MPQEHSWVIESFTAARVFNRVVHNHEGLSLNRGASPYESEREFGTLSYRKEQHLALGDE